MKFYLPILYALASFAMAQPTNLQVEGTPTPTEFAISYDAPNGSACTLEVSESNTYSPLVNDVNTFYFPSSNSDLIRSDTVVTGLHRIVFIGKSLEWYRDIAGVSRSRALQANTLHFVRVGCGSAATTTATTGNIPLGQVATTNAIPVEGPYKAAGPSQNPFFQSSWVDPSTGLKIHEYPDMFGVAYAGSTGATGRTFGCAENITSGWAASDAGTLVNALSADNNVYAQTSTAGAKLFAGLCDTAYNKYPMDNTFSNNELSYQNVKLRIDCTGAGCGGGKTIKIALTTDRGTVIQTKTFTATTTETQVILCHPEDTGSSCPTQADAGDIWSPDVVPRDRLAMGIGYVYNDSGDYTRLNFLVQADCDNLRAGDLLSWWDQGAGSDYHPHVSSTNCGAVPPRVVLDSSARADGNSTSGIPFTYSSGIANNSRYGFLIWSDDDLTSSTIRIDQGLWRAASYIGGGPGDGSCASGSGGFNKRAQKVKTTNGFTLFACGSKLYATKAQSDGTMDMRFLGITYVRPDIAGQTNSNGDPVYFDNGSADFFWSDTEAGVIYLRFPQNFNSPATGTQAQGLGKFVLEHPETACGQAGTSCMAADSEGGDLGGRWPLPDFDSVNSKTLTACLNSCSSASADDYTIAGQILRIDPGHDFTRWPTPSVSSVSGSYIKLKNRELNQDSFSQSFMFDIGDGNPIGGGYTPVHGGMYASQQIFAFNPTYATKGCRWGEDHTDAPPLYSNAFTVQECGEKTPYRFTITTNIPACSKSGSGTCSPCPAITVDGVNYTGKSICLHATQTSAWPGGACGMTPDPSFVEGDPVNTLGVGNPAYCWLQHQAVGDIVMKFGSGEFEAMKLIQRNSATDVYYERGCNSNQSIDGSPKNWGSSTDWSTIGNSYDPVCDNARTEVGGQGQQWDFINDPLAADTAFTQYVNHAFLANNHRVQPDYFAQIVDFSSFSALKVMTPNSTIILPQTFSGVMTIGSGTSIEKHPSYANSASATAANKTWFLDANPMEFFYEGSSTQHTNVTGQLWKLGDGAFSFDPKLFPIGAFSGQPPYLNISGPGSSLGSTFADAGKFCIVAVANECRSGSVAGDIYANGPLDPLEPFCRGIEVWFGELDTCVGDLPNFGGAVTQWVLPTANGQTLSTNHFRVLSRENTYRSSSTTNVKANPDGDYLFFRESPWYAKLPPFPAADSVDRTHFIGQAITVSSVPAMTSRVLAKFGYDEDLNCTFNRADPCYAVASSVNNSNPFLWEAELTSSSGVSCAVSCAVVIPWLEGRVPRYQLVYRDSGGNVLETGALVIGNLGVVPPATPSRSSISGRSTFSGRVAMQ